VFEAYDSPVGLIEGKGIPDLFIHDRSSEWFFVEVKSTDSLKRGQFLWLMEFDCLPARVVYADEFGPVEEII